jgi:hypothetical protein
MKSIDLIAIALYAAIIVGGFYLLTDIAEAGSAQTFIRQHFVEQPTEVDCS